MSQVTFILLLLGYNVSGRFWEIWSLLGYNVARYLGYNVAEHSVAEAVGKVKDPAMMNHVSWGVD